MDLLYLNLAHLIRQANASFAVQRQIYHHANDLEPVIVQEQPTGNRVSCVQSDLDQIESQLLEDLLQSKQSSKKRLRSSDMVTILPGFVI